MKDKKSSLALIMTGSKKMKFTLPHNKNSLSLHVNNPKNKENQKQRLMKLQHMAALVLVAMMTAACGNNTQNSNENTNTNENSTQKGEKQEVKDVPGRKNFSDEMVITPLPAIMIATWDEKENPDVMMAAWGGQCGPKHITFTLSAHKTTENIRKKQAFTVSFADRKTIAQSDYFGIVSANDVPDKVKKAGFTVTKSPNVDAPIINEYPLTLECKVVVMDEDEKGGARIVGEVVNMSADESILDADGKIDLEKLQPVVYDSSKQYYRAVGEKVGEAWSSGKAFQEK